MRTPNGSEVRNKRLPVIYCTPASTLVMTAARFTRARLIVARPQRASNDARHKLSILKEQSVKCEENEDREQTSHYPDIRLLTSACATRLHNRCRQIDRLRFKSCPPAIDLHTRRLLFCPMKFGG